MNIYTLSTILTCLSLSFHSALASRIDVVNENEKPLKIKIQAEGSSVQETLATYITEISAKHQSTFSVEPSNLGGKSYYSIKGDTNPFTPGSKCENLSVEKNYKVTFLDKAVGTTCVAEETK
jgi:hypothetical protein